MCFDYRDLNKVITKRVYLILNIDVMLDCIRWAKFISEIDLKNTYLQIELGYES